MVVEEARGLTFRWGYAGEELVAEWAGVLVLRATRNGDLIDLQAVPGASRELVEKTRVGVATAFLRAQRHQHSLHASAVALEGNALVCVGASGLGKSTVAERMCRHAMIKLLADDIAAIELVSDSGVHVLPSESSVWLETDNSTGKAPVKMPRTAERPSVLQCIVSLVFDAAAPGLELREVRGANAVSALLPSLVRFEKTAALWTRELDFVARLVSQCRVVQATRSRDVDADAVAHALLPLLAGDAQ
jgi:hypothetical protein